MRQSWPLTSSSSQRTKAFNVSIASAGNPGSVPTTLQGSVTARIAVRSRAESVNPAHQHLHGKRYVDTVRLAGKPT